MPYASLATSNLKIFLMADRYQLFSNKLICIHGNCNIDIIKSVI